MIDLIDKRFNQSSTSSLLVLLLSTTICFWLVRIFKHPLKQIPGPIESKLGFDFILKFHEIKGTRTQYIHKLHRRFGSVVRVGKNEVSVTDRMAIKMIYSNTAAFPKDMQMYHAMQFDPAHPGVFNMSNKQDHSTRRRLIAPAFSKQNLDNQIDYIIHKVEHIVKKLEKSINDNNESVVVDWLIQWRLFTADVVVRAVFGQDLKMTEDDQVHPFIKDVDSSLMLSIMKNAFGLGYKLVDQLSRLLPRNWSLHKIMTSQDRAYYQFAKPMVENYAADVGHDATLKEVVSRLLGGLKTRNGVNEMRDVVAESINLLVAGIDTTSTTITYAIWRTLTTEHVRQSVFKELESVFPSIDSPPTLTELEKLPVLTSIIQETLRLHSAAPATLPRVCKDGMVINGEDDAYVFIPPGTTVGAQAYTVHRDVNLWGPDADEWKPQRWQNVTDDQEQSMRPFSTGPTDCLGQNMAWTEMYMALAFTLRFFKGRLADDFTDNDMAPLDWFLLVPKGHACRMRIENA
ncbi:hypothetical protein OIO90_005203 [Microbotryomycetes sp. JL221]|nr:hypothetical protein OIO90_005203 [Microbotryomycetes sp. JL221]